MNKHQGIALITVLIFLQILAVLGLCAIQMALSETKQSQLSWRRHQVEHLSSRALQEVELNNFSSECVIPESPLTDVIANLPSRSSCAGNFQSFQYYYAIESLGIDPCAYIQLQPKKSIANYYRITLLGIMTDVKVILQSTWIIPFDDNATVCKGVSHAVAAGRQNYRYCHPER